MGFPAQSEQVSNGVTEIAIRHRKGAQQVAQFQLPVLKAFAFGIVVFPRNRTVQQQIHEFVQPGLQQGIFLFHFRDLTFVERLFGSAASAGVFHNVRVQVIVDPHLLEDFFHLRQNEFLAHPELLLRVFRVPRHEIVKRGGIAVLIIPYLLIRGDGLAGGGAGNQPPENEILLAIQERLLVPAL